MNDLSLTLEVISYFIILEAKKIIFASSLFIVLIPAKKFGVSWGFRTMHVQ